MIGNSLVHLPRWRGQIGLAWGGGLGYLIGILSVGMDADVWEGLRRGQALCSVLRRCQLDGCKMNLHKLETPCLVLHEFSSRAQIIISSPVETLAASYFTTAVTTNASPERLEDEVRRSGWMVLAYCWMPNQIHALIQTSEPNLASGMQHGLSGYANWYAKRNRRTGHLYLSERRPRLAGRSVQAGIA